MSAHANSSLTNEPAGNHPQRRDPLRRDAVEFLDRIGLHCAHLIAAARRGERPLGCPFEEAEQVAAFARDIAREFTE